MTRRGGALAGLVVATVALAGCDDGPPWEAKTYVFTVPFTAYDGLDLTQTVLVRDGEVTDVWITPEAREAGAFGYTPYTPLGLVEWQEAPTFERTADGVVVCSAADTPPDECTRFENVRAASTSTTDLIATWQYPADGDYTLTQFSVTWGLAQTWRATVADGEVVAARQTGGEHSDHPPVGVVPFAPGATPEHRVMYWVVGADAPFAACVDDPMSYDEEYCWEWGD